MTYRQGRILDRRTEGYSYYHGHLIKPKRKLPRALFALAMLILLPCFGVWLATNNFSTQPEQVLAETNPTAQALPVQQEPEKLPQVGPGSDTNAAVQRYLHEWTTENKKTKWAVYAEQIGPTKQVASVNADRQFGIGSLYKLFIPNALASSVPTEQWAKMQTSASEGRSIERCVSDMLRSSDNSCGEALAERIGWGTLNEQTRSNGYVFTNLNSTDYLKGTARDMATLLKDIQNKNGFSDQVRNRMLTAMKEQRLNKGIPAGCTGCVVYNKTGDADGFRNDAAIIERNGKTYVIVILSEGGSYQQIAELTKGILDKFEVPIQ